VFQSHIAIVSSVGIKIVRVKIQKMSENSDCDYASVCTALGVRADNSRDPEANCIRNANQCRIHSQKECQCDKERIATNMFHYLITYYNRPTLSLHRQIVNVN
jgi:hypothetical protein